MKKLIIALFLLLPVLATAKPFLTCDPQEGCSQYRIECPIQEGITTHWEIVVPAQEDGSLLWDLQQWPHGKGRFNCTAFAGAIWEIIDDVTGNVTTVFDWEEIGGAFTLKVPAYKIKNITGTQN
jgi:hypothetical protein